MHSFQVVRLMSVISVAFFFLSDLIQYLIMHCYVSSVMQDKQKTRFSSYHFLKADFAIDQRPKLLSLRSPETCHVRLWCHMPPVSKYSYTLKASA